MVKAICQSRSALVEECGYIAPCWPALITVKDVVVLSIASPYYAKGNLFAYARGCSDAEKLELLCQAAEPLAFMHNIGNVHGNVRPVSIATLHREMLLLNGLDLCRRTFALAMMGRSI